MGRGGPAAAETRRGRTGARALLGPSACALVGAGAALALIHATVVSAGAPWERRTLLAIHAWAPAWAYAAAADVTRLGYPEVIVPVLAALVLGWLLRGQRGKAALLLLDAALLAVVDYAGKALFARPRPALFPHPPAAGAAYPSGHALFAVGYYGMIALLGLTGAPPLAAGALWCLWALVAAAVGASRLLLGVHWPTDVIAGYAAGGAVLLALARGWRRAAPVRAGQTAPPWRTRRGA